MTNFIKFIASYLHLATKVIAPFITPRRILMFLLCTSLIGTSAKIIELKKHTCPKPIEIECPKQEPCPEEIPCIIEIPTCPTIKHELIHPNPKCQWVVHCEE